MATVYRGYDPRFKREVAVKILPPEFLHASTFRARFEREAQTIAGLEHPAIVPVYDYGEENDQPYLVMRLMAGGSLADRLARGPLPLPETADIIERLAPALDRAHGLGIIHRDLKPGNILFDGDGHPYISDFGLAKLTEPSAQLSQTGVMGTPAYMAPEQARGDKQLDGRADLYALGVILYHMLTGRPPYEADTPMGVAFKHVTEPPPRLSAARPDLPLAFDALITQAMAKDPAARFQTAAALQAALARALSVQSTRPGADLDTAPTMMAAPDQTQPMSFPPPAPPVTPIRPLRPITASSPPPAAYTPPPSYYSQPPEPVYVPSVPPPVYNRPPTPVPAYVAPVAPPPARANRLGWGLLLGLGLLLFFVVIAGAAYVAVTYFNSPAATPTLGIPITWTPRPVPTATNTLAPGETPATPAPTDAPTEAPTDAPTPAPLVAGSTQISSLDGMVQLYVPAGEFGMGSDSAAPDQAPFHAVTLDAFWIDQTEVTVAQYIQCVKAAACSAPLALNSVTRAVYYDNSDYFNFPVIFVNWPQAGEYCLSVGRRLPTEAEWEKAARGPDALIYPWGNDYDGRRLNACDINCSATWHATNNDTFARTGTVGVFATGASPYGVLDLAGNVSEWVDAYYDFRGYFDLPTANPPGLESGLTRVLRGGSWLDSPSLVRAAARLSAVPDARSNVSGFRCAASSLPQASAVLAP